MSWLPSRSAGDSGCSGCSGDSGYRDDADHRDDVGYRDDVGAPASSSRTAAGGGWRASAAYGLLGAPLAMAALPLFVQLPAYYATHLGVALAPLGGLLFAARLLDMLQDPLLGHLLDRADHRRRRRWLPFAALLLAATFAALWLPPSTVAPAVWLPIMLVLAYGAHSLLNIAYLAWGAQLRDAGDMIRAVAWREGAGLAGMLLASVIPAAILAGDVGKVRPGLAAYSIAFAALLLFALATLLLRATPAAPPAPTAPAAPATDWRATLRQLSAHRAVRTLLPAYFINALSVAIPATLALFFIADQLQAPQLAGAFLASYFGAAACALPAWTALTRRLGPLASWRLGMLLSVLGFAGAALLGPGNTLAYFAVCIAAGAALGADLTLPPVLLGYALGAGNASHGGDARVGAGATFGVFTLLGKLALAVAGLALPLLAWLDYRPGTGASTALTLTYAAVPCLLKLCALAALTRCAPDHPRSPI